MAIEIFAFTIEMIMAIKAQSHPLQRIASVWLCVSMYENNRLDIELYVH